MDYGKVALDEAQQAKKLAEQIPQAINDRFAQLTTQQQQASEVIDARNGATSLKARLDGIDSVLTDASDMIAKKEMLYNYTLANTLNISYGTRCNIFGTKIGANKNVTVNAKIGGTSGLCKYILLQMVNGVLNEYYVHEFNAISNGINTQTIPCITKENTYVGVKTTSYTYLDDAPAAGNLVGGYYVSNGNYAASFKPTLITTSNLLGTISTVECISDKVNLLADQQALANIEINAQKTGRGNVFVVGLGSRFTYNHPSQAEAVAQNGDTVVIYPGTYTADNLGSSKKIHWIGVNKHTCIITNGLSEKAKSVFDLSGGSIRNLTIIETHETPSSMDTSVVYKAYCVHADMAAMANQEIYIENCILKNRYFACFGIGLYTNCTLNILNCDLHTYGINPNEANRGFGALFGHGNTTAGTVNQKLKIHNCYVHSTEGVAMRIDKTSLTGSSMEAEFIGNTCISDELGITGVALFNTSFIQTKLSIASHGNNVTLLNYTAS
jgi:hypothetical protein